MMAPPTPFDLGAARPVVHGEERSLRLGPAEGWVTVLLLALICALVGWAMDDSRWVLGDGTLTDFLPWAGALGVAWGFGAAKLHRGRLVAHLGGAIAATTFLTLTIGARLAPGASPIGMFDATAASVANAWIDLAIKGHATTTSIAHFLLVLGGLCWGTGQFAAYAAYAHRRPLAAVVVPGSLLLGNVALTTQNQYPMLVVATIAGLLFLVRFHVADEERAWVRNRIGDVGDAAGLSVRAGLTFVSIAVVGSLVLTGVASSAPLADAWSGIDQQFVDIGTQIARWFPAGGPGTRIGGVSFGPSVTITGVWITDNAPLYTVSVSPGTPARKWIAATYDHLSGNIWSWSSHADTTVAAGTSPMAGTADAPLDGVSYASQTYTVTPVAAGAPRVLLAPGIVTDVSQDTRPTYVTGGSSSFFALIGTTKGGAYSATAAVARTDEPNSPGDLTANRLRAAGTDYPADVKAVYTSLDPGTAGQETQKLLSTILAAARPDNPYDVAKAIESYLRDGNHFTYSLDVSRNDCSGLSIVDCFVTYRTGYCEYYASTMVVMLRLQGIPARLVEGFLPGQADANGVQTIRRSGAHAWVQAYFPGVGWVDFDPTGGGVGQPVALPAGPVPSASPSAGATSSVGPGSSRGRNEDQRSIRPGGAVGPVQPQEGIGPAIVLAIPAVGFAILLVALWFRRRWRRPVRPEAAYRTVAMIAGRLGYRRRPTQTVYEYLGTISDALPVARPDLQLVARSAVEATYGHKQLSYARMMTLGEAQRRLRLLLLRLVFRRRRD